MIFESIALGLLTRLILTHLFISVYTLRTCLVSLQSLLSTPEPNDPQDAEVAKHYLTSRESFDKTAAYWTQVSPQFFRSALFVRGSEDAERRGISMGRRCAGVRERESSDSISRWRERRRRCSNERSTESGTGGPGLERRASVSPDAGRLAARKERVLTVFVLHYRFTDMGFESTRVLEVLQVRQEPAAEGQTLKLTFNRISVSQLPWNKSTTNWRRRSHRETGVLSGFRRQSCSKINRNFCRSRSVVSSLVRTEL